MSIWLVLWSNDMWVTPLLTTALLQSIALSSGPTTYDSVHNHSPAFPDCSLHLLPSVTLGALDQPAEQVFGQVDDVDVDPNGNLFILDSQAREVRVFSPSGHFLRRIGSPGPGPGEFQAPSRLAVGGGKLFVLDRATHTLSRFGLDGTFEASRRLRFYPPLGPSFLSADSRSVFLSGLPGRSPLGAPIVRSYDHTLEPKHEFGKLSTTITDSTDTRMLSTGHVSSDAALGVWFIPWVSYAVQYYDRALNLRRIVTRRHDLRFYPPPFMMTEEVAGRTVRRYNADRALIVDLTVDEEGFVWVLIRDRVRDRTIIDTFNSQGRWLVTTILSSLNPDEADRNRNFYVIDSRRGFSQVRRYSLQRHAGSGTGKCPESLGGTDP